MVASRSRLQADASATVFDAFQEGDLHDETDYTQTTTQMQSDVSLKMLMAGGVAGAAAKSLTAPFARLTILYQVTLQICIDRRVMLVGL